MIKLFALPIFLIIAYIVYYELERRRGINKATEDCEDSHFDRESLKILAETKEIEKENKKLRR